MGRTLVLAVPAAEASVPALVLLGRTRAAGIWALVLLVVFSVELLRLRRKVGHRVPCGCFGGRSTIDIRSAVGRNASIGVLAVLVVVAGHDWEATSWPGAPAPGELLPMLLASIGTLVGVLTVWRASVWLTRGRRA